MRAPACILLAATAAACGGPRTPTPPAEPEPPAMFRATVRWTGFGVPHVTASDPAGLGFGQGWATAKQHLCRLADQFVRVRGERARYFGAGPDDANLDSDFFHLALGLDRRAKDLITTMSKDARDLARGWVAGYNHYVTHSKAATWPDDCRDAPWVRPIDELDLARLDLGLAATASSRLFETAIARAAPDDGKTARTASPGSAGARSTASAVRSTIASPGSAGARSTASAVRSTIASPGSAGARSTASAVRSTIASPGSAGARSTASAVRSTIAWPEAPGLASNGWALGGDRSESGYGLVVANPHFPWHGDLTFSEIHLTIPGELDVYGATIPGVPMVGIGFTPRVAWTHTFSSSTRFLLYSLRLLDGDPMRYERDDGEGKIVGKTYEIGVRNPDGSIEQVQRTLYRSAHGPMLASAMTPWSSADGVAYSIADVALDTAGSVIDLYLGFARAEGLDDFRAAIGFHATPFLNTIYADVDGNAWYVDGSAVPNLSDDALVGWELARKAMPALAMAWQNHVAVVDGSSSIFDLITDDPEVPGAIPLTAAPELLRRDYVFNANDSYGYTNPDAAMSGFSPFYGDAVEAPSPRGLMNLRMLREKGVAAASGSDGYFNRKEAAAAMLSNRSFTGEQLRDEVHTRCLAEAARRVPAPKKKPKRKPPEPPREPRLAALCSRLDEWDLRFGVTSRGAVLWREFIAQLGGAELPWAVPFDADAPSTPSGLAPATGPDPVIAALERAVDVLAAAGIDYRTSTPTLGDVQHAAVGSRASVPGGISGDGTTSVAAWRDVDDTLLPRPTRAGAISETGLGTDGYQIDYGTSWVMAVDLLPTGPEADVLMTYGPGDQLALYERGQLRPALFRDEDINADPDLVVEHLEEEQTP